MQRFVKRDKLIAIDTADLFYRVYLPMVERSHDIAHLTPFVGQLDVHRTAIDTRRLMVEEPQPDQFLKIIRNVGANIIPARAQLSGRKLLLPDVVE